MEGKKGEENVDYISTSHIDPKSYNVHFVMFGDDKAPLKVKLPSITYTYPIPYLQALLS